MPSGTAKQRGPDLPYKLLAGVVPCPAGWLVADGKLVGTQVFAETPRIATTFREILDNVPGYLVIAVTLPIGLPTSPKRGGRAADREARAILGFPNAGAIGSTPTRRALAARGYQAARQANGGLLDVVTWQSFKRIRELDDAMEPYQQRQVYEVRPELSFMQLNEEQSMKHAKDSAAGRQEREALLRRRMPSSERILNAVVRGARREHLVDGAVTLWTARRITARAVSRVPETPEWDAKGLRMEIVR